MRRAAKVDSNQREIIKALKDIGASVQLLHQVGGGCPDVMVGYRGVTTLLEVKNPAGLNKVSESQKSWQNEWCGGPVWVVRSAGEAIDAVT